MLRVGCSGCLGGTFSAGFFSEESGFWVSCSAGVFWVSRLSSNSVSPSCASDCVSSRRSVFWRRSVAGDMSLVSESRFVSSRLSEAPDPKWPLARNCHHFAVQPQGGNRWCVRWLLSIGKLAQSVIRRHWWVSLRWVFLFLGRNNLN